MSDYTPERLIYNVINNFTLLQSDFIGISLNIIGVIEVLQNILFVLGLAFVFYAVGEKIRSHFFNVGKDIWNYFINIALGYIAVATGVSILGIFSILYTNIILAYLIIVVLFALYPFSKIRNLTCMFLSLSDIAIACKRKNAFAFWGTVMFILVAFLRLIPPEIGEDAIGYHTTLPSLYLKFHSIVIDPKYSVSLVFPIPQLGEMPYVIAQSIGLKDASRYIHFMFYVYVALLLSYVGSTKRLGGLGQYAALLFVTAPVVVQVSSRANADFQWLLCWLLSVFLITKKNLTSQDIKLSAILFGGVLATKIWAIAFVSIFFVFLLYTQRNRGKGIRRGVIFLLFSLLIPLIWYIRSYFLTGNPFYPGFSGSGGSLFTHIKENIGFNKLMFNYSTLVTFSPLFYFGILLLFTKLYSAKKLLSVKFLLFFIVLFIEYVFLVRYGFSRYLLVLYSLAVLVVSAVFKNLLNSPLKHVFYSLYLVMFLYYFVNAIFALPYGFGWADKNRYLTGFLSRDNSSYYDFNRLFDKWISKTDLVVTYGIYGYYYVDFKYIDASNIYVKKNRTYDDLKKSDATMLFIKGGNFLWFCEKLQIEGCQEKNVSLLATFPKETKKYNLYKIINR